MANLVAVKVNLTELQRKRLAAAYHKKEAVSLQISPQDYDGQDSLLLTQTMARRLAKHKAQGTGIRLQLSKNLVLANAREGGFLGAIMKFLPKLLPKLANGAATAFGTWATEKALNKIAGPPTATAGQGLYLPGAGLYLPGDEPQRGRGKKKAQ